MPTLRADMVGAVMIGGDSCRMDADVAPKFKVGDKVEMKNINPMGHTRLQRYCRGKKGVIDRDHGVFRFPDACAHSDDYNPQHCYSVKFTMKELWGDDADDSGHLYTDMFDDYMVPAP